MASVRIRLEIDPQTSKRTVVIGYESDSDALPHEHEEAHRKLVQKLFEGGIAREGDAIRVERETPAEETAREAEERAEDERRAVKEGS
jgi:hypothetical protein